VPYHVVIRLPGDRIACADYRDPVAQAMHKVNRALSECRPPDPAHYETVAAWLDSHAEQSATCYGGLGRGALPCGHD
jgi:hypothetical protein